MIQINYNLLQNTINQAKESPRKRKNFNFHKSLDATLQRMINALEPGTHVQPHKHENPDKVEVFIILTGKLLVVEFDDQGKITDHIILSRESGNFGVEIPPKVWHCIVPLENGTVVFEAKDGPYSVDNDKVFAPWAPGEESTESESYTQELIRKCVYS
jgi:cupin fold WbuC family metalloprotein